MRECFTYSFSLDKKISDTPSRVKSDVRGGIKIRNYSFWQKGPHRDLNPGPLPPKGRIIPLDHADRKPMFFKLLR